METMLGAATGAEILRALVVVGNCLVGDLGELAGEEREGHLGRLSRAGLGAGTRPGLGTTPSSSGRGPRMDPPLAELTPDIADTEILSSPGGFCIREFCIAA